MNPKSTATPMSMARAPKRPREMQTAVQTARSARTRPARPMPRLRPYVCDLCSIEVGVSRFKRSDYIGCLWFRHRGRRASTWRIGHHHERSGHLVEQSLAPSAPQEPEIEHEQRGDGNEGQNKGPDLGATVRVVAVSEAPQLLTLTTPEILTRHTLDCASAEEQQQNRGHDGMHCNVQGCPRSQASA